MNDREDTQRGPEQDTADAPSDEQQIAYGITLYVTAEGYFGSAVIGECGLTESIALMQRALNGALAQFNAQVAISVQHEMQKRHNGIVLARPGIENLGQ
jgi:hypothetical protein